MKMNLKNVPRELIYLAIMAFGINICFTFQVANLSSIFKFLGAGNNNLPLLWLIPPLTGLIVQPLIGQMSDDTISRYGKRRPYLIFWGALAAFAFCLMPFAHTLFFVLILTWTIDCSLNGGAEALRALTGDVTFRESERSKAFALQAFLSGVGGALGTSLPYLLNKTFLFLNINDSLQLGRLPINLRYSFIVIAMVLSISIFLGLKKVHERPYTRATLLEKKKKKNSFKQRTIKTFSEIYRNFKKMPPRFRKICLIHATTWVGIFIFWLYFTATLAQNFYHMPINTQTNEALYAEILQKANLDSSFYFTIYQYVSVAYAMILYFVSSYARIKLLHAVSLIIGGISLLVISFAHDVNLMLPAFVGIGIMWGSMAVIPYAIAMEVLPKGKVGAYLGIFNICITAPQIICGLLLSPVYTYVFQKQAASLMVLAGLFVLLSAYFWFRMEKQSQHASLKLRLAEDG